MNFEIFEAVWCEEDAGYSISELADLSGLPESDLRILIDYQALTPVTPRAADERYGAECLAAARIAQRLRNDFELDAPALALALTLLDRINQLEAEIRALRAHSPQRHV